MSYNVILCMRFKTVQRNIADMNDLRNVYEKKHLSIVRYRRPTTQRPKYRPCKQNYPEVSKIK